MLISYISEPKDWSPGNAEVSPCFYLSIQDPTEKCPVFAESMLFNEWWREYDAKNLWALIVKFWAAFSGKLYIYI